MKKFSKILTSILAVSVLASCFVATSFAASKARTYTVKADKTEALEAGDVVTIEVLADELLHAWNAGYTVHFDPDVFTIDTASGGRGKPKKYVDEAWYTEMNDASGIIGWYWGASRTTSESAEAGTITCAWSGNVEAGEGVTASDNQLNYAIGKYYLIVKDNAPTGETQITVDGATYGFGENAADPMTYVPATLTVGSTVQEPVVVRGSETFVATATDADGYTGVKFNFTTDYTEAPSKTGSATVAFGMALENGSAVVALTVNDIIKSVDGADVAFNCTGVELY